MDKTLLRDKIFSLHTRKFGAINEKLVERILEEFGFVVKKASDGSYDRQINDRKDEIKGSRVLSKSTLKLDDDNIIESLLLLEDDRYVTLENAQKKEWDCNIQQIKTQYFETLWYVLFFQDCVTIFKINNTQIHSDKKISYSNKQHRGNTNEGQFHVTNKNIQHHIDNYLVKKISYEDVLNKLTKKTLSTK